MKKIDNTKCHDVKQLELSYNAVGDENDTTLEKLASFLKNKKIVT